MYKSHVYCKHRDSQTVSTERPASCNEDGQFEIDQPPLPDDACSETEQADLREIGARFILGMKEGLCLSQEACDQMVSGVKILCLMPWHLTYFNISGLPVMDCCKMSLHFNPLWDCLLDAFKEKVFQRKV